MRHPRLLVTRSRATPKAAADWVDALRARAPQAVALGFGALIAVDLAYFGIRIQGAQRVAVPSGAAQARGQDGNRQLVRDTRGLFGATAPTADAMPAAAVPLALVGTIATENPENGFAIIGETAALARLVRAGAAVATGILLASVFPDHVVVSREGRLEAIALPRSTVGASTRVAARARGRAEPLPVMTANGDDPAETVARPVEFASAALFHALMLRPGSVDGHAGRVVHGPASPALTAIGLASGDTLISVNGVPIGEPDAAQAFSRILDGRAAGSIDLLRNHAPLSVQVTASTVAAAVAAINKSNGL